MTLPVLGPPPRQKVFRAGFWSFALLIAERGLGVVRIVILAIFLSPREFGLFGIAILTMAVAEALSRTGFQQALIHETRDIRRHLDVAWTVQMLRGFLLALLLLVIARRVGIYFDEPAAVGLIQMVAIALVFQGLTNIGVVYFHKELDFRKEFTYRISGTLADLIAAAGAAWLLGTAWALVLGLLAGDFVRLIVSYLIHPYRPRMRFERQPLVELVRYGIWLSLTGTMLFIGSRAAGLVVGKLAGTAALGLYQMAARIPHLVIRQVSATVENVAFPTYSLAKVDRRKLRRSYLGMTGLSVALAAPTAFGIAIVGPEFTRFLLGDAWLPMVPALTLLAFAGLARAVGSTGEALFMACGMPKLTFYLQATRALILALLIYPLTRHWAISGAALCMIVTAMGGCVFWVFAIRRLLLLNAREFMESLFSPLLAALVMSAVLLAIKAWTLPLVPAGISIRIGWLTAMVLVGLLVYLAALWACQRALPQSVLFETARSVLGARGILGRRGDR